MIQAQTRVEAAQATERRIETIRRDLSELQTQGKVLRNHGRAKYIHRENQDSGDPFHIRLK
ncbi:DeoR family transcriptional regulator, partial [Salmonella enterica subsp. enterica serovar Kentucky]|nr:DeoR family transcriptional regulator [Salmonella enterica subsp. enterica serovar Kentucky]